MGFVFSPWMKPVGLRPERSFVLCSERPVRRGGSLCMEVKDGSSLISNGGSLDKVVSSSGAEWMEGRGILTDSVLREMRPSESVCSVRELKGTEYSTAGIVERIFQHVDARKKMRDFLSMFQGEFDNYEQVLEEKAVGLYPREGGGHEHIHCQLTILDEPSLGDGVIFAKYYFDGDPSAVFRSRLYQVSPSSRSADADLRMRIFRLCDVLERELRRTNYDPHAVDWQLGDPFTYLCGCDVFWKSSPEASKSMDLFAFEGFMKNEGCRVFSPQMKQYIAIKDDLTLGYTHLAVNDRGFDQEGRFVYGNRRGVPYNMRRIEGPKDSLWWTVESDANTRKEKSMQTSMAAYVQKTDSQ